MFLRILSLLQNLQKHFFEAEDFVAGASSKKAFALFGCKVICVAAFILCEISFWSKLKNTVCKIIKENNSHAIRRSQYLQG